MAGKALPVGSIIVGSIFVWSALFNKTITSTIQSLVQGEKPKPGPMQPSGFVAQAGGTGGTGGKGGSAGSGPVGAGLTGAITGLLHDLGAPASPANLHSMQAWYTHENSGWPPGCANNPWNSTQKTSGSTYCAGPGVQNYPNIQVGVHMNALTMMNGLYPNIVAALRAGRGVCGTEFNNEFCTWSDCSKGGYGSVC